MTPQRFSLVLKSRWGDEPNTVVTGLAHPDLLWIDPETAPEGTVSDWILWSIHHLLDPKSHTANEPDHVHISSPAFASRMGVRMFPGFVQAFTTLGDAPSHTGMQWVYAKGQADALYTSASGQIINASHRLALKPKMLQPFPDNLPFGREGYHKRREAPNDIVTMEAELLMGAVADAGVDDVLHPVFTLFAMLRHMPLPCQPAWPDRMNNTGWTSLYRDFLQSNGNPAVGWGYDQQILRPRAVFSNTGFVRSERWEQADKATHNTPARAFGAQLADVAQRHDAFLRSTHTSLQAVLVDHGHQDLTLPLATTSAHHTLAWTAFFTDLYAAGVRTGLLAPKGASQ